ncbi:hypothetical protein, partial [Hymenobacter elongatus]|uniref:hypothetical protein n=1 Tax=Hymenobacter elongatus TaxID=877208 RepID=UPI001AEC4C5A
MILFSFSNPFLSTYKESYIYTSIQGDVKIKVILKRTKNGSLYKARTVLSKSQYNTNPIFPFDYLSRGLGRRSQENGRNFLLCSLLTATISAAKFRPLNFAICCACLP